MEHGIQRAGTRGITAALIAVMVWAAPGQAQKTAAVCVDGTTSTATGRGACSGHGGVDKSATKAVSKTVKREVKAAKAVTKRTPGTRVTTLCTDGSTSNASGRGACSGHGGVRGAEVTTKASGRRIPVPSTSVVPASPRTTRVGNGSKEDDNPAGAIAQCKDGLYSHAVNHQGACGHHGGVSRWM
jgi:hypothetical protein